ncbi:lipopolysaccharide biosynthesis protein [Bacteroidia bacterium]|nr:lipopolysaccharide biosynthesis protein [Bacteroidia bacterium]
MAESTLKQKTASGLFWGGLSTGAQQLISLVFGIFLARLLNPDDYGLVGMLAIFTAIASTIINSGFSTALTNKKNATEDDYNAVFWFTVFAGLLLYLVLYFCAPFIARFFERPELTDLSRVLFISFFIGGIGTVSHTILFKKIMAKQQAIIDLVALLSSLVIGILLAFNGFAYWALAIQTVIQVSLGSILRFIIAPWKPSVTIRFSPLKPMLSFSIKLFLTNIFMQINTYLFTVIFGKFYNAEQVGYYTQGQKWMVMGNAFTGGMINYVAQPILVQMNEDKDRQVGVLRKLIRFGAFVSCPLMLGLAFIGKEFIVIAIGEKWLPAVPFLQLFCIWGAVAYLWNVFTNLIFTHGKSNIFMYVTLITGLLQLLVVVCMYPFGIFPMVIGYLLMNIVGLFIWQYYTHKLIGLRLMDVLKDILPYLGITLGCFLVTWLLTKNIVNLYWLMIAKIVISGVLYILILKWSHSVIFKESMDYITNIWKKSRS